MKYGNRTLTKKLLHSPISMAILVIFLFVLSRAAVNIHSKAVVSEATLVQTQAELSKLKERQLEMSSKVAYLSTEQGIEAEARTKYHAVREGESVAVIVDDAQTAAALNASTAIGSASSTPSWWRKILQVIGF